MFTRSRLGAIALGLGLAACGGAGTSEGDLRQTTIAPDFQFAASRPLALAVSADDRLFGDVADAQLIVRKASGAAVFRGAIRRGATVRTKVMAPLGDQTLEVTVAGRGGEASKRLSVGADGQVAGRIE
jgi:hypothetical protein